MMGELPQLEETPFDGQDVRFEALRQGTSAADAAWELAAAVTMRLDGHAVRTFDADALVDRSGTSAMAGAEAAAGHPAWALAPERNWLPTPGSAPTETQQTGIRRPRQGTCSICGETGHGHESRCRVCSVLGHKDKKFEASAAENKALERVDAHKVATVAARDKANTCVPRASRKTLPLWRACCTTGHIMGAKACSKSKRVLGAAMAYSGDSGFILSLPDPHALAFRDGYASTKVSMRLLLERHPVRRGKQPNCSAAEHPPTKARSVQRELQAAAAYAQLQQQLGWVAEAGTKQNMVIVKALEGAASKLWAAAKRDVLKFMDSFPVHDLTDGNACAL